MVASVSVVLLLVGGGIIVHVGAAEGPAGNSVLFGEILDLVLANYVDPVEADGLLEGAYEGLLASLDANGAYLSPHEVAAWKAGERHGEADPGLTVLKTARTLLVVSVTPGSPASEAGLLLGDQIRMVDGRSVRDLSLEQNRRLLSGAAGTTVKLGVVHPRDGFKRDELELTRVVPSGRPFDLDVQDGVAVLRFHDLARVPAAELVSELDDVRSRGVEQLLLDLRSSADGEARTATDVAGLFLRAPRLVLRARNGELMESVEGQTAETAWAGQLAVLVNGATAGGAEALTQLVKQRAEAKVFGETTFGMGAESDLVELENGAGLLLSIAQWETEQGESWNGAGITPDREVSGDGDDYEAIAADQLNQVLEIMRKPDAAPAKAA